MFKYETCKNTLYKKIRKKGVVIKLPKRKSEDRRQYKLSTS